MPCLATAKDRDLSRYRDLSAGLKTAHIPHSNAVARARAERNARLAAWDGVLAGAAVIAGTALFSAVVAAAAFVIGGVL